MPILHPYNFQLTQLGIDLRYQLDGHLRTPLARALQDAGEKYVDAIKVRAAEDTWRPSNQSSQNLQKLLTELEDLGIGVPSSYMTSETWLSLTSNTLAFSRLYVGLLEDCLSVNTPELMITIDNVLVSVMRAQVQHLLSSLSNPKYKQEVTHLIILLIEYHIYYLANEIYRFFFTEKSSRRQYDLY